MGAGSVELEIRVAEKIIEHVPSAEKVLFSNSGSEATYHAIRVSRAATGRPLVVKFQGGYHGWHDYIAANVISRPERVGTIDPISDGDAAPGAGMAGRAAVQRRRRVRGAHGAPRRRGRGGHPRADHPHDRLRRARPGVPRGAPPGDPRARLGPDLRRGRDRVPPRPRRLPGDLRRHARPDARSPRRWPTATRSRSSCGRADLMDRFNTRPDGRR